MSKIIFDAINNIDEEYVNSAGKYLKDVGSYGSYCTEPMEVQPSAKKRSPLMLAAPIVAAVAVICGVAFVSMTQRPSTYLHGVGGVSAEESEDNSSDVGDNIGNTESTSDNTVSAVDEATSSKPVQNYVLTVDEDDLPIGPDGIKLTDGDFELIKKNNGFGYTGLKCKFAYFDEPTDGGTVYNRYSVGDDLSGATVGQAYSTFELDAANSTEDKPVFVYKGSHLEIGLGIRNAYLIRSSDSYRCVLLNKDGEIEPIIPPVEFTTLWRQGKDMREMLDKYCADDTFYKIRIALSNVTVDLDAERRWTIPNNKESVYLCSIQLDNSSDGKTELSSINFDDGADPAEVAAAINSCGTDTDRPTVEEIKSKLEPFGFTDIRIFDRIRDYAADEYDAVEDLERTEGEILAGSEVVVYDENGICGLYFFIDLK